MIHPADCGASHIQVYGWDSPTRTWHGPNELSESSSADTRLLRSLRSISGKSWYGSLQCGTPGQTATRFFTLVHDLSDCAIAFIYCDESKAGPAGILAVIPARCRVRLRDDFAFEFLAFARFLGALQPGSEVQLHDCIAAAIADPADEGTLVFAISSGLWPGDLDHVLSCCVEKLAATLCRWLEA